MSSNPPVGSVCNSHNPATAQHQGVVAFATNVAVASGSEALPTPADAPSFLWIQGSETSVGPVGDAADGLVVFTVPANCNLCMLSFFGTDGDGETGSAFVAGYRATQKAGSETKRQYDPEAIATLGIILGAKTGVAGGIIDENQLWADEIVETTDCGFAPYGGRIVGPAAVSGTLTQGTNSIVSYLFDPAGASHLALWLRVGTAAGINAVFKAL